jgi:hypothetical protein
MKPALVRQLLARLDAVVLSTNALFTEGNPDVTDIPPKQSKSFQKRLVNQSAQRMWWEKVFRMVPDGEFDEWMSYMDEMPGKMLASLKERIANMPKDHGGRPPHYPRHMVTGQLSARMM